MSPTQIKYFFILSLVINGILISAVVGFLPFLLFIKILIIAGLIWYCQKLFSTISQINLDIASIFNSLDSYYEHVESLYSMEMFYGDESLEGMLQHSKYLLDELIAFQEKYSIDLEVQVVEEETIELETTTDIEE